MNRHLMTVKLLLIAVLILCAFLHRGRAQAQEPEVFRPVRPRPQSRTDFHLGKPVQGTQDFGDGRSGQHGQLREAPRERVFETVIAVGVPTTIPRVSFNFETIVKPFVKGNSPELETEVNFHWLRSEDTKGWVESHFDIVDKYSPGGRPHNADRYTHKLNFELDTAVPFLKWTKKPWLSDIEIEGSLDYVASGLPRAGDRFGNATVSATMRAAGRFHSSSFYLSRRCPDSRQRLISGSGNFTFPSQFPRLLRDFCLAVLSDTAPESQSCSETSRSRFRPE